MANETRMTIIGNLTADPEYNVFGAKNTPHVRFTVASTPSVYNRETSQFENGETLFMDCYAWAPLADNVNSSLTKGMRVIVRGQLERETWQTAEGENRSRIRLRTEDIGPSLLYQTANISKSVRQSDSVFPSSFQNQPANSAENSGINSANDSNRSNEANSQMPTDNPFDTAETNESVSAQGGSNINIVSPKAEDSDEWSVFDDTSADSNTSNSDISNPKIEDSDLKISDSQNENSPNNDTEVFNLEEGNPFQ